MVRVPSTFVLLALLAEIPGAALPQSTAPAEAAAGATAEPLPEPGSRLPPAFRVDTYHRMATEFLRALPETSRVRIERASGVRFELELAGGRFAGTVPPSSLSEDATTLTTPLGFRLSPTVAGTVGMIVTAPNGRFTEFTRRNRRVIAREGDGNTWNAPRHALTLRLPDATRVDMLEETQLFEVITLLGERYRYDSLRQSWTPLGRIPSPPLIPDIEASYVAGNGDDWRFPFPEDHTVFAWSWYPYGFTVEDVLRESWRGFRKDDIAELFEVIEVVPEPVELGGYLLARRLALGGGDRLIIERPGEEPSTVYLLPGTFDPNFFLPRIRDWNLVHGNRSVDEENRKKK